MLENLRRAKKVGFVFSGGATRAVFQAGVAERLVALGIKPAVCVGVSGGVWNAAFVAAHKAHRLRYGWKSYARMPHLDLANFFRELSPWRYAEIHRRNCARFLGDLKSPDLLPLFVSVTRLRDGANLIIDIRTVENPIDVLLASNYLPPFYTRVPLINGERYGDGGPTNNAPYEVAFEAGCDMVVLITMKGESEGGIFKSANEVDHVIARDDVVVIRPRHRLPYAFVEHRWEKLSELITLGDLRTREVLLGERHAETDIRAEGDAPSVKLAKLVRTLRDALSPSRP